jgi:hypothetical protein
MSSVVEPAGQWYYNMYVLNQGPAGNVTFKSSASHHNLNGDALENDDNIEGYVEKETSALLAMDPKDWKVRLVSEWAYIFPLAMDFIVRFV